MSDVINISAIVNHYALQQALKWLGENTNIPISVLRRADVLIAQEFGLSPAEVCCLW